MTATESRRRALLVACLVGIAHSSFAQSPPRDLAGVTMHRDLAYVENGHARQKLDLYVPLSGEGPFPLIAYFHGGGYVIGDLDSQRVELTGSLTQEAIAARDAKARLQELRAAHRAEVAALEAQIRPIEDAVAAERKRVLDGVVGIAEAGGAGVGQAVQRQRCGPGELGARFGDAQHLNAAAPPKRPASVCERIWTVIRFQSAETRKIAALMAVMARTKEKTRAEKKAGTRRGRVIRRKVRC